MCCNWQKPIGTSGRVPFRWLVRVTSLRREWCIYIQVWVGVYLFGERAQHCVIGGFRPRLWLKLLHCCPGLIRKANSCFLCRGVGSSLLSHVLEERVLFLFLQFRSLYSRLGHVHDIALSFTRGRSPLGGTKLCLRVPTLKLLPHRRCFGIAPS